MDNHIGGFVDGKKVLVFVENFEGNIFRNKAQRLFFGNFTFYFHGFFDFQRCLRYLAVDTHMAAFHHILHFCAGN